MAGLVIVSWRDIPAQVIVKAGRRSARRPLPDRFQEAIDRAAMRAGLRDTDAYLGEWRRT
ncbi:MAG: virulence factor, partial [Geminicoccales bacterium]